MKTCRIVAGLAIAVVWTACEEGAPVAPEEGLGAATDVLPELTDPQPAAEGVLYACYNPSGMVYRIRAPGLPDECHADHVVFSWNAEGPEGPQGADGAPGEPGAAGADGVSGWELRNTTVLLTTPFLSVGISCTPGKKVLSGGYSPYAAVSGNQAVSVEADFPSPVLQDGWIVAFRSEPGGFGTQWNVWAICASVT